MLRIGLTGGIGSGKSTVARLLAERGAAVVDADRVAREVVEPGSEGLAAVVAEFGESVLLPDGSLDRPALGRLVFTDPASRARLNALLHPRIAARSAELMTAAQARDPDGVLVHDVALLVENDLVPAYDLVVVVDTDPEVAVRRLVERRGLTVPDARARIGAQTSRAERLAVADEVLRNDGEERDLERQVEALWQRLLAGREARGGGDAPGAGPGWRARPGPRLLDS